MDNLQQSEAARLFHDFTTYWHQTANIQWMKQQHPVRSHKLTDKRLKLFQEVITWCRDQQLDPRLWVFVLFESRQWTFAPKLEAGYLMTMNEKIHKRYERLAERSYLDGYQRHLEVQKPRNDYDPNRDLNSTVEARKMWLVSRGLMEQCIVEVITNTLGYHPKSAACQRCGLNDRCRVRLEGMVPFDIVALRDGRMTQQQARLQAKRSPAKEEPKKVICKCGNDPCIPSAHAGWQPE